MRSRNLASRSCQMDLLLASILVCSVFGVANAHTHHEPAADEASKDWATRHMSEEHHIDNFDPLSFHRLHDFDDSGAWTTDEIHRFYGFDDESTATITAAQKSSAVDQVMRLFDPDHTGTITRDEFVRLSAEGHVLPDFGFGPGHHGDDEYEYEIHHFEKFHGEDATEEDLIHPEDIEHFRKHDEMEDEAERVAQLEKMPVVEANIPGKFWRQDL